MGKVNETIKTVNATLRTLLMTALVAGAGYGGYLVYGLYNEPQQKLADKQKELDTTIESLKKANVDLAARQQEIGQLNTALEEKAAQVERLEVAMKLLKVWRRLARLTVLEQSDDPNSEHLLSRIEFVEVNEDGQPIGEAKQFDIVGDLVYIDYLRVTFDDRYIEESDLDRSTAICLFQRIFGEHQEAVDGFQLDNVGTRPTAYARGTEMSEFERKIWDDFWLIANDRQRAVEMGIHAAHAAAVAMRVQPGKQYEIDLRSTGDITIRPVENSTIPGSQNLEPIEPIEPAPPAAAGESEPLDLEPVDPIAEPPAAVEMP